jgi:hypothetical protein
MNDAREPMQASSPTRSQPASSMFPIPPFLAPEREGELAARVIGEVMRQGYAPAVRASTYLSLQAGGRATTWQAWSSSLHGFAGSMFQHPFVALVEAVGLDAANERIEVFGRAFAASFEQGLDLVAAGTLPGSTFTDRDQARMRDWLRLLEEVDDKMSPILDQ